MKNEKKKNKLILEIKLVLQKSVLAETISQSQLNKILNILKKLNYEEILNFLFDIISINNILRLQIEELKKQNTIHNKYLEALSKLEDHKLLMRMSNFK